LMTNTGRRLTLAAETPPDINPGALVKLVESVFKIVDEVRENLITLLSGVSIQTHAWWGAQLLLTKAASEALQRLIDMLPDLSAILALMMLSRTAALIYVLVSASGKAIARRLKMRTTEKGVFAVLYFYAIPFVDPVP
jgi:hypothetical protein